MVKKFFFFFVFVLLVLPQTCLAREKSSQDYYGELLQNYRLYQSLIEPFNTQKSRYQTYGTVETQADFLNSAKELVRAEIASIRSYVYFVRTWLAEATKILNYQESYLYLKLDDELAFLNLAEVRAKNLSSLTETNDLLKDLKTHYENIGLMGYQAKSVITGASVKRIWDNLKVEKGKITGYLDSRSGSETRISVAKEKMQNLAKKSEETESGLKRIENLNQSLSKGAAEEIQKVASEIVLNLVQMVSGYKNVVKSL